MAVLTEYTSGSTDGTGYNIVVVFEGSNWTEDLQQAFIDSTDYFSTLITGDLTDITADFGDGQGVRTIDDMEISATLATIDGAGGILGSAGPNFYRTADFLPITGSMTFDVADAQNLYDAEELDGTGDWTSVVQHEMIHTMGFGPLWDLMGLLTNDGTEADPDYHFTGANAVHEYEHLFPTEYAADPDPSPGVPVESSTGSLGTDGGHWTEAIFDTELMTGFLDDNSTLSNMSIAALVDMGYVIADFTPTAVCFANGTSITTKCGKKNIETLSNGDLVSTMDHGFQPILWIGSRKLDAIDLALFPHLRPVQIAAGALGHNIPNRTLTVSPQHRMLVRSKIVQRMFNTAEVLVPAIKLLDLEGVSQPTDLSGVTYFHMLFDKHEVIYANNAPSESLYTGAEALNPYRRLPEERLHICFPKYVARLIPPYLHG